MSVGSHYYEQHGAGTDQAPAYCEVTSSYYYFKRSGTGATLSSMAASDVAGGHMDQAIIEIFRDANDRTIVIVYGFGHKGTTAGSLFMKFHMWPTYIGILNHKYIIIQWENDGDGIVEAPGVDSYFVLAAGP